MGVFIGASTKMSTAKRRDLMGEVPAYSVSCRLLPGKPLKDGSAGQALLRGDRQARGCADALEDEHQRFEGLTARRH